MTSRALALLTVVVSPVFVVAAVAGWLTELWPANLTTLVIAAFAVASGPLLGMVHVATAQEKRPAAPARPVVVTAPAPPLTQRAAAARAFHNWRDSVHPAIERRERERRASRWIRST